MESRVVRTYDVSDMLQLRYTEVHPRVLVRGVWARIGIELGTLVEECPVVPIYADEPHTGLNMIRSYAYGWKVRDDNGNLIVSHALSMGMGGIYNHAQPGNITNVMHRDEFRMEFFALRDIDAGEELTHNYGWGRAPGARLNPVDRFLRPIPRSRFRSLGIDE